MSPNTIRSAVGSISSALRSRAKLSVNLTGYGSAARGTNHLLGCFYAEEGEAPEISCLLKWYSEGH